MPVELLRAAIPREKTEVFLYCWKQDERVEAREYLVKLKTDGHPDLPRIANLFRTFVNSGIVYNEEKFKDLGDGCFEFKAPGGTHIGCFFGDKEGDLNTNHVVLVLTHGFKKPRNNKAYQPHKKRIQEIVALYRDEQNANAPT